MLPEDLWVKENYYVFIDDPLNKFYKITRREAFDYETGEEDTTIFSSVAAGGESGFKNIDVLEPDKTPMHLFQVLWGVKDTQFKYYIKLPTGTNRHGTDDDKDIGFIDFQKSPAYDPNPAFMFWIVFDYYPAINAKNVSPFTLTPKIYFTGMKYDIEEITDKTIIGELRRTGKYKRISIAGIRTTSGVA